MGDQDLLSGSLEDFLAQLSGENLDPIVRPPGNASDLTSQATAADPIRAGLASLHRARVVDAFGQYVDLAGSSASAAADQTRVAVGAAEAIDGQPGLIAMVPRFNAPARVMLRYADANGDQQDASTAISPLCGFVLPSALDGSLEFFGADGSALGRLRPDPARATVWEEDPGEPASLGAKPSSSIPNPFLGAFADGLLASDTALAAATPAGQDLPQTALAALEQLIDTTRWTVDSSGTAGDEHLALLLGHPIAVLRAGIKIDVQSVPTTSTAPTTAVPVKLGTLAHTQRRAAGVLRRRRLLASPCGRSVRRRGHAARRQRDHLRLRRPRPLVRRATGRPGGADPARRAGARTSTRRSASCPRKRSACAATGSPTAWRSWLRTGATARS